MKSGPSYQFGRALALLLAFVSIFAAAVSTTAAGSKKSAARVGTPPPPTSRYAKPLSSYKIEDMPTQRISLEQARAWNAAAHGATGLRANAAPVPPPVTPQFYDLTTVDTSVSPPRRPPFVGRSTSCQEIQPTWSWDQQFIYFASNNVDSIGNYGLSSPGGSAPYHIYRITANGSFVQQVTGTTIAGEPAGNQFYPSLNHSLTRIAYIHRDGPTKAFELYVLDLQTGARTQLTGINVLNNPLNGEIINVQHPTWSPSDTTICFSATNKDVPNDAQNLYTIDLITNVVTKITNSPPGVYPTGRVDLTDAIYHPNPGVNRICFTANTGNPVNGAAVNNLTGDLKYVPNPLQDLRRDGTADDVDHNLFTIPATGPAQGNPIIQLTTDVADDVEPIYESSNYPPGSVPAAGSFNNYLAWSTLGRLPNAGAPPRNSYDIVYNNGSPEAFSPPVRLFTPDTNAGAIPLHQTDERYPTWSAALPQQNPIDRIVFSSNRSQDLNGNIGVANPGDTDLWSAEVTDITPPTLFSLGDQNIAGVNPGETLHIANAPLPNPGRRNGSPGDTFYFYAKVLDGQYGVESVWLQIKDPDGPETDSLGNNNKLYGYSSMYPSQIRQAFIDPFTGDFNNTYVVRVKSPAPYGNTHWMHLSFETDYRGIGVNDYQYYNDAVRNDPASRTRAQYASKSPGVDDSVRWSGNQDNSVFAPTVVTSNRPPLDGGGKDRWLRLRDDGVFPDLVAGDGIYSASWVTPNTGSDFYVDLIAYDKAFNPQDPTQQGNWIVYDNIWGFSTQQFTSLNPILYVDDNGSGQKWPRGLKGTFRPFPTFRFGTESEILERPDQFQPKEVRGNPDSGGTPNVIAPYFLLTPVNNTDSFLSSSPDFHRYPGSGSTRNYHYDYWRILARGPVPDQVLALYTPRSVSQPADLKGSSTVTRLVPRRAILWNAPYTGDVFLGAGSILDQAMQASLMAYHNAGGRLVIAGGDILWALTSNGSIPPKAGDFISTILGATFTGDAQPKDAGDPGNTRSAFTGGAIGNPVTHDVFGNFWNGLSPDNDTGRHDPIGVATFFSAHPRVVGGFDGVQNHNAATIDAPYQQPVDGTPFQNQDGAAAMPGVEQIYTDRWVGQDDTNGTTKSKTLFLSFSLASLGRGYITDEFRPNANIDADPLYCMNFRAKISHAMFCWMFSAELTGQIKTLNGTGAGVPIAGAFVEALNGGGQQIGSAYSQADGTYLIEGLPVGSWGLRVTNPGYATFSKQIGGLGAHGLGRDNNGDVLLVAAPPGSISGKAVDKFGQPIANVQVQAVLIASPLYTGQTVFLATTGPDGKYTIPALPAAQAANGSGYTVTVVSFPNTFTNPTPSFTNPVDVNPASDTPNIDFTFTGNPGPLTVSVFEQTDQGTKGNPIPGADVTLLDPNNAVLKDANGNPLDLTTDVNGVASFPLVPAGPVTVSVFKRGFQENTAAVNIPQQSSVEILLPTAPARNLYGLVKRAIDGKPLAAGDLPVTLTLLRRLSQQPFGLTADVFAPTKDVPGSTNNPPDQHNYVFQNAQAGQFTIVLKNHPRYQDVKVDADIVLTGTSEAPVISLQGKPAILHGIVADSNGVPIPGATITVTKAGTTTPIVTLTSQPDGSFTSDTNAPLASDVADITVAKFGYTSVTLTSVFLAGDTNLGTVKLTAGPRGQLFGVTERVTDKVAQGGVTVQFFTLPSAPGGQVKVAEVTSSSSTTSGPDGKPINYTIGDVAPTAALLPAATYEVRVTGDPRFANFTTQATVAPQTASRLDIDLTPLPGVLSGKVLNTNGQALNGATVTILQSGTTVSTVTTDSSGHYQTTSAIPAGSYTVSAAAFGYVTNSVTVFVEGPTTAPDLILTPVPPSLVTGVVKSSALDGALIGGASIQFLDPNNNVVATGTSSDTGTGNPVSNFSILVPPGTYTVTASKTGWSTGQVTGVKVNPNQTKTGVTILLTPEHTFGKGLLLISLPYDYPGQDAASVLGQDAATFKSAFYVPNTGYSIYPTPPANEFRLGKGMFVRFNQVDSFSNAGSGTPAPDQPFFLPVTTGWNLIGSVRKIRIEWLRVKVQTSDGTIRTMQQAYDAGLIQNGLWSYQDGYFPANFMEPFSGYFMRALRDCTLIIPTDNSISAAPSAKAARWASNPLPSVVQVALELQAAGLGVAKVSAPAMGNSHPARPLSFPAVPDAFGLLGEPAGRQFMWRRGLG